MHTACHCLGFGSSGGAIRPGSTGRAAWGAGLSCGAGTTEEFWGGGQSPQPSGTLLAVCWGSGARAQGSMAAATSKSPFYPEGCLTVPGS